MQDTAPGAPGLLTREPHRHVSLVKLMYSALEETLRKDQCSGREAFMGCVVPI